MFKLIMVLLVLKKINREFKDQAYVDVNRDRLLKRPS